MAWLEGREYFWVVFCKNRGFHNKYNLFSSHAIPLAETDEVSPHPLVRTFAVRCDDCGEQHTYTSKDVLRAEMEPPESFTPHPLFQSLTPNLPETPDDSAHEATPIGKTVLDRIRAAVAYLHFRHKDPLPHWRTQRSTTEFEK